MLGCAVVVVVVCLGLLFDCVLFDTLLLVYVPDWWVVAFGCVLGVVLVTWCFGGKMVSGGFWCFRVFIVC